MVSFYDKCSFLTPYLNRESHLSKSSKNKSLSLIDLVKACALMFLILTPSAAMAQTNTHKTNENLGKSLEKKFFSYELPGYCLEIGNKYCCYRDGPSRLHALVFHPESDYNGAFSTSNSYKFMGELFQTHNLCTVLIEDKNQLCQEISNHPHEIDVLILQGHGSQTSITFGENSMLTIQDSISCLNKLKPGSSILLDSCNTGEGEKEALNLANHIARQTAKNVNVIAARKTADTLNLVSSQPFKVDHLRKGKVVTYNIKSDKAYKIKKKFLS